MKFSLSFAPFFGRVHLTLARVLTIGWWFVVTLILAFLAIDGLLFYLYGMGRAEPEIIASDARLIRVHEETLTDAAEILRARQERFLAPQTPSADVPNPFR